MTYDPAKNSADSYREAIAAKRAKLLEGKSSAQHRNKRHRIGPANPIFKGGKSRDANGYVTLTSKAWGENTGRREHQVVAEKMLGRKLRNGEVVHHKNGVKHDNRPENLEVLTRAQHNRQHGCGQELICGTCGSVKWYSPTGLKRFANLDAYQCRACAGGTHYKRTCKRCDDEFTGGKNARFCGNCTRKKQ